MTVEIARAGQCSRQDRMIELYREFQAERESEEIPSARYHLLGVVLYALAQLINNDGPAEDFRSPF